MELSIENQPRQQISKDLKNKKLQQLPPELKNIQPTRNENNPSSTIHGGQHVVQGETYHTNLAPKTEDQQQSNFINHTIEVQG